MVKLQGRVSAVKSATLLILAAPSIAGASPVPSRDTLPEPRLRKMEAEIRALQRNVFPGGAGKFFTPEIRSASKTAIVPGRPASTPIADLLSRMESVERALSRLTSGLEQTRSRITQLESRQVIAKPVAAERVAPGEVTAPFNTSSGRQTDRLAAVNRTVASGPSAQRIAAVSAIIKPRTSDPGDDEYSYGFRLWQAKLFPEAQQQLKLFIGKYRRHSRISFARNLLGRAFLDDNKPRQAASWFLQNYQSDKTGVRAPDSLLFLAESMHQLKDEKRACIALAEFSEVYETSMAGRLKTLYDKLRDTTRCG